MNRTWLPAACLLAGVCSATAQQAPPSAEALAKELANPIANLISVPFQGNVDVGIGAHNGSRLIVNVQPVIPFKVSKNLNLITRWIVPVISQYDVTGANSSQSGLGDAIITAFVSPASGKITWGIGPAFLVPIATNENLGTKKFAIGPSAVVLKQSGPWTYGGLVNHLWSVAGDADRSDVSATFLNPFLTYNWKSGAGANFIVEFTHDWVNDTDALVVMPLLTAVTRFGNQTVSFGVGPRLHFLAENRPSYGVRAAITLVFPKGAS